MHKCGLALNTVGDFVFAFETLASILKVHCLRIHYSECGVPKFGLLLHCHMVFPEVGEFHLSLAVGFFHYFLASDTFALTLLVGQWEEKALFAFTNAASCT